MESWETCTTVTPSCNGLQYLQHQSCPSSSFQQLVEFSMRTWSKLTEVTELVVESSRENKHVNI